METPVTSRVQMKGRDVKSLCMGHYEAKQEAPQGMCSLGWCGPVCVPSQAGQLSEAPGKNYM